MNSFCPKCRVPIPLTDVNVATDLALCRACGETFSFAALQETAEAESVDLARPPRGAWFHKDNRGFEAGASTRSWAALFLVPFMAVWSGFSLGGIYGSQMWKGEFNLGMSLFGIPFVLGTLLFGSLALMSVCGKVVVSVRGPDGLVFTGIGPVGWRRRFRWNEVTGVRRSSSADSEGHRTQRITLEGPATLHFGTGLSEARRDFLLAALNQMRKAR